MFEKKESVTDFLKNMFFRSYTYTMDSKNAVYSLLIVDLIKEKLSTVEWQDHKFSIEDVEHIGDARYTISVQDKYNNQKYTITVGYELTEERKK